LPDLILFLKKFGEKEKIHILGAGSNTLISDEKFDGVVIKLGKNFSNISILPNDVIIAGSACLDKKLSDFALNNGIGGFEFLACIPGTIGGGLKMNAGCFDKEFKDVLVSIQAIDKNGQVLTIPASKVIFKYRSNDLKEDLIFLSASFKGLRKNKEEIEEYKELLLNGLVQPTKMEIYICNVDGSNLRQVTNLGDANWSPFFHPSNEKIIFCSNHESIMGFPFNLYMIDIDGNNLEQITYDEKFASFPVFSNDGKKITFSSNRNNGGTRNTNVFIANWKE